MAFRRTELEHATVDVVALLLGRALVPRLPLLLLSLSGTHLLTRPEPGLIALEQFWSLNALSSCSLRLNQEFAILPAKNAAKKARVKSSEVNHSRWM